MEEILHQFSDKDFYIPKWKIKHLFIGTFNPKGGEKVKYYYGRETNKTWKILSEIFKEHTATVLTWLKKFTIAITFTILTFLIFVIGVIYSLSTKQNINDIVFYSSIPVAISLFYLSSYLIINSNVFLGLPYIEYNKNNIKVEVLDKAKYEAEIEKYLQQLGITHYTIVEKEMGFENRRVFFLISSIAKSNVLSPSKCANNSR